MLFILKTLSPLLYLPFTESEILWVSIKLSSRQLVLLGGEKIPAGNSTQEVL